VRVGLSVGVAELPPNPQGGFFRSEHKSAIGRLMASGRQNGTDEFHRPHTRQHPGQHPTPHIGLPPIFTHHSLSKAIPGSSVGVRLGTSDGVAVGVVDGMAVGTGV
jgi:hypothetical protein